MLILYNGAYVKYDPILTCAKYNTSMASADVSVIPTYSHSDGRYQFYMFTDSYKYVQDITKSENDDIAKLIKPSVVDDSIPIISLLFNYYEISSILDRMTYEPNNSNIGFITSQGAVDLFRGLIVTNDDKNIDFIFSLTEAIKFLLADESFLSKVKMYTSMGLPSDLLPSACLSIIEHSTKGYEFGDQYYCCCVMTDFDEDEMAKKVWQNKLIMH